MKAHGGQVSGNRRHISISAATSSGTVFGSLSAKQDYKLCSSSFRDFPHSSEPLAEKTAEAVLEKSAFLNALQFRLHRNNHGMSGMPGGQKARESVGRPCPEIGLILSRHLIKGLSLEVHLLGRNRLGSSP